MNQNHKNIAPIIIKSDIEKKIELVPGVFFDKFTEKLRGDIFNWQKVEESDTCKSVDPKRKTPYQYPSHVLFSLSINANYMLIYEIDLSNRNYIDQTYFLENTFRLISTGNLKIALNWFMGVESVHKTAKCYCNYFPYSEFNKTDIKKFAQVYNKIVDLKENKILKLIFDKLDFIVSGEGKDLNKFLDLMTILEMLYLPENNSELSFRLSIRLANMFGKFYKEDKKTTFDKIKYFYDIRSSIVHTGEAKYKKNIICLSSEKTILIDLLDVTRKSILLYVEDPNRFKEDELNNICFN